MLRYLPSAIDDAFLSLYEPDAVLSQFLGFASKRFFLVSVLFFLFHFVFCCFSFFLFFLFSFFRFFVLFLMDLRLSVCVVIATTCNMYIYEVVLLGWQPVKPFFPSAKSEMYALLWNLNILG